MTADTETIYTANELRRGYAIDMKRVVLAYLAETVTVVTSLIGAWLFAEQYGHHDRNTMIIMSLAPIAYAVVEFCRVPLAITAAKPATHSWFIKSIIVLGLLGAGTVTIKSVSQLGEIMFRPRLVDVVHAKEKLVDAQGGVAILAKKIADADALVVQRQAELATAHDQFKSATEKLSGLPKQDCSASSGVTRNGHAYKSIKCVPDPRIAPFTETIATAARKESAATALLNDANSLRSGLDRTEADKIWRTASLDYREAVMNSQLHSFTAMVFGVEPTEVTDAQVHLFLRIFVFIPAIGAAFSATIIALTAVQRVRVEPTTVEITEDGGEYLLGPLAAGVIQRATEAHLAAVRDRVPFPQPA
jgi:hypothetical protein